MATSTVAPTSISTPAPAPAPATPTFGEEVLTVLSHFGSLLSIFAPIAATIMAPYIKNANSQKNFLTDVQTVETGASALSAIPTTGL